MRQSMAFAAASIIVSLAASLAAAPAKPAAPWSAFELKQGALADGVALHYAPEFEPHLPAIRDAYERSLQQTQIRDAAAKKVLAAAEPMIADLNRLVGLQPTAEQQEQQKGLLQRILGSRPSMRRPGQPIEVYLLSQDAVKAHLQTGAQLPGFTYDPQTQKVNFSFNFGSSTKDLDAAEPLRLPLPLDPGDERTLQAVETVFGMINPGVPGSDGLAVHELAELAIVWRMGPYLPYGRWFGDGFANALTLRLLREHVDPAAAAEYAAGIEPTRFKDLTKEVNLAYWMGGAFEIQAPTDREERIKHARYAFATVEVQRLIEAHGWEVLDSTLDRLAADEQPGSRGLEAALAATTGEDVGQRLRGYQSFGEKEQGLTLYHDRFEAAMAKSDYEAALSALIRGYEVAGGGDLKTLQQASFLLHKLGHEEASDQVYLRAIAVLGHQPEAATALRKALLMHAVQHNRPAAAYEPAEALLETEPTFLPALTVRMHRQAAAGDLEAAKGTARQILTLAPQEDQRLRQLAEAVLRAERPGGAPQRK